MFDVVVMIHSIEHLYNLRKDIKKISDMLKKNGTIYIMTPNFKNYLINGLQKIKLISKNIDRLDPTGHPYMFTIKTLTKILTDNGFKIIRCTAGISGNFLLKKNKFLYIVLQPLFKFLSIFNIGSTLIAVASKD